MVESLFEFLFKYRPLVYERGELVFGAAPSTYVVVSALAAALVALVTYAFVRGRARPLDRALLAALRLGALGLVALMLLRPALRLSTVVPQQNFVGVVLDDSRSMGIADVGGEPRAMFVTETFGEASPLVSELAERFALRFFRFAGDASRLARAGALRFNGTRTDVGGALLAARDELAGVPLAGLVVVTDGADNARSPLSETLLALRTKGVPVYTVGVGAERLDRDIQLSRVETPRVALRGASLSVDLVLSQSGYRGRTVPVRVEDEGRIVAEEPVTLPGDGEATTVRLRFRAEEPGPRRFTFRVPVQDGERVAENNVHEAVIEVRDRREKILYVEGEPRFEVKFIRRAVEEDGNLQVVVLQRTAENKFLRLEVDEPDELIGGFPKTREELFAYRGLILGSVEASFFTLDQLRMIEEFVDERGGGLLALGGRNAFGRGGYEGTPVADVLPVVLDGASGANGNGNGNGAEAFAEVTVRPTRAGAVHAVLQVAETEEASRERWRSMPAVSTVNPIHAVKPGATTLLAGDGPGGSQVVLAYQRYGRGKAMALTVQDSWLWQMDASVPLDDMTHERFWRQLLRWLIDDVPGRVTAALASERAEPGAGVEVRALVEDSAYVRVNDAVVTASVLSPSGVETELPLDWTVERDGEYAARLVPAEPGLHEIHVRATRGDIPLGEDAAYLVAGPATDEYFDAAMHGGLLRRVAAETGGRFYTPETVDALPEDLRYTGSGATVVEELELWDMPALLLLLLALLAGEWTYRRSRRLA